MESIYTLEEVSQYLKVPVDAIKKEIASGRLEAMNIGGFIRIREIALARYKNLASEGVVLEEESPTTEPSTWFQLEQAPDFDHTWPDGNKERFRNAQQGTASFGSRSYHVKLGFTVRESAGKPRLRCMVMIDRYPTVEFVKGDDLDQAGPMAGVIRNRANKQLPADAEPPAEYAAMPVGAYRDVVDGPGASSGLAVICDSGDFETMLRHALIRYRYREERPKKVEI